MCLDLPVWRHRAGGPPHRAHPLGPQLRHHAPLVRVPRLRGDVRQERHRHRRQDHRQGPRAGPPVVVHRLRERARLQRRLHGPGLPAPDLRAARHRSRDRDGRDDAHPHRARPRLRGRRQRLLRRPLLALLPGAVQAGPGRDAPARRGGHHRQARPPRLRHVEGHQARRARLGDPVGPRAPRLAPGVLGDGPQVPGLRLRHPRRRPGPDLPAPRERDRAGQGLRRRVRPLLGAQRLGHHERREDVQVARQQRPGLRDGQAVAPHRAPLLPGHPALPLDHRVQRGRPARGGVRLRPHRGLRAAGHRTGRQDRGARRRGPARLRRGDGRRPGRPPGPRRGAHHRPPGQQRAGRRRQGRRGRPPRRGARHARRPRPGPARPPVGRRVRPERGPAWRGRQPRPARPRPARVRSRPQGLGHRRRHPRPARPGRPRHRGQPAGTALDAGRALAAGPPGP
ncbi:Cysteinyl-tRNA synthetase [Streptomyces misionensis JCM 4497]